MSTSDAIADTQKDMPPEGHRNVSEVMINEPVDGEYWKREDPPSNPELGNGMEHRHKFVKHVDGTSPFPLREKLAGGQDKWVLTNHFEIYFKDRRLFNYQLVPALTGKSKRKIKLIYKTVIQATPFLKDNEDSFAIDSQGTIIAWEKLYKNLSGNAANGSGWNCATIADGQTPISLSLRFVEEMDFSRAEKYVAGGKPKYGKMTTFNFDPIVTASNSIISKGLSNDVVQISSNKFYLKGGWKPFGTVLYTMRGYSYTVKPGMGKILLNINSATSAFYQSITVDEFMRNASFSLEQREGILKKLRVYIVRDRVIPKGATVEQKEHADYLNNPQMRVKTIYKFGRPIKDEFFEKDVQNNITKQWAKKKLSVRKYLKEVFGEEPVGDSKAVNVGSDIDPRYYPQEWLRIMPFQICKQIPDELTTAMLQDACHTPARARALIEAEDLKKLGVELDYQFKPFVSRILSSFFMLPLTIQLARMA